MNIFNSDGWHGITLMVTKDCNLHCSYCYECDFRSHQSLSFATGVKIIDWFYKYSKSPKKYVSFYGGEPLLQVNLIKDLVNYCYKRYPDLVFSITTNGTLVNESNIDMLKSFHSVVLSLDGPEKVHDLHRHTYDNKSSFSMINFDLFRSLKNLSLNAVITPKNVYYLNESMKYISEFCKNYKFKVAYELDWMPNDILEYKRQLTLLADKFINDIDNPNRFYLYKSIVSFLNFIKAFYENPNYRCDAGINCFTFTPSGNLYPCYGFVSSTKASLGNIFDKIDLSKIETLCNNKLVCQTCKNCTGLALCPQRCYSLKEAFFGANSEISLKHHVCDIVNVERDVCLYVYNKLRYHKEFNKVYKKSFSSVFSKDKNCFSEV